MATTPQEKRFYGVVPVYKKRFLGIFDTGELDDASLSDVAMICPDEETAIKYMSLLNGNNIGLIDAPHGVPSDFLVHHWVIMKMDTYTSYEENKVYYGYKSNRVFGNETEAYTASTKIVKVQLNRLYTEGCCNA